MSPGPGMETYISSNFLTTHFFTSAASSSENCILYEAQPRNLSALKERFSVQAPNQQVKARVQINGEISILEAVTEARQGNRNCVEARQYSKV